MPTSSRGTIQADAEEQKHDTEIGEGAQELAGCQPAKHLRANQNPSENFSHDARLSEALEDFRQKLGGREDQQHGERNLERPKA
jgi:hypothetical protein